MSFNPNHVFALSGTLNSQTATVYGTQAAADTRGFNISLNGITTINLAPGQTTSPYGLAAYSVNGYGGTLYYECLGLPSQVQCQLGPAQVLLFPGGGAGSEVVFSAASGAVGGSYPFTLRATDGVSNYDLALTLNVGDFTMSISPPVQQALPTDAGTFTINLASIYNYEGQVELTCSGLPAGANCPTQFGGVSTPGGDSFPMTVTTQSVPGGNYPFTVTGVSPPLSHSVSATFADGNLTSTLTLTASGTSGSVRRDRSSIFLAAVLLLPTGALFVLAVPRRKKIGILLVVLVFALISCGGGSSSGGGGGGGGTQYSIDVQVTYGNTNKTAGTITLTVNPGK